MQWYGSLENRLEERCKGLKPEVGMGVTEMMWSDREPYEIIEVKDERHIVVRRMNHRRIDNNGMSECQEYEYTSNPDGYTCNLFLTKSGRWVKRIGRNSIEQGSGWYVGRAEYYYDYSF